MQDEEFASICKKVFKKERIPFAVDFDNLFFIIILLIFLLLIFPWHYCNVFSFKM
jgi:hypothetical protein